MSKLENRQISRWLGEEKDNRPKNCRFRLQEEGKPYPRSACQACGKSIVTGLDTYCKELRNE